jgi:hypothetical protein
MQVIVTSQVERLQAAWVQVARNVAALWVGVGGRAPPPQKPWTVDTAIPS